MESGNSFQLFHEESRNEQEELNETHEHNESNLMLKFCLYPKTYEPCGWINYTVWPPRPPINFSRSNYQSYQRPPSSCL